MNSIKPGNHFILRRPYGGKDTPDRLFLVEVGTRKPPRPYTSEWPADSIELIMLGVCDSQGNLTDRYMMPYSLFTAPGVVLDRRFYTPIRVEKAEAA